MRLFIPQAQAELGYADLAALYEMTPSPVTGRWVRANVVTSVDGAAQGPDSRSGSLSSAADKALFRLQRSLCDAVLVGADTARTEGYRPVLRTEVDVNLRRRLRLAPLPTIVVVSRSLALDPALLGGEAATVVVTCASAPAGALRDLRSRAHVVVAGEREVDVPAALAELARLGHRRILCEGGPTLLARVLATQSLDELCVTTTALLLGGDRLRIQQGPSLTPPPRLTLVHLLQDGNDLFARYLVDKPA